MKNSTFDSEQLMPARIASINNQAVTQAVSQAERLYHWPAGRRPNGRPGLTELGL